MKNKFDNFKEVIKTSAIYEIYTDCKFFFQKHKYLPLLLVTIILSVSLMLVPLFNDNKYSLRRTEPINNLESNVMYIPIYVTITGEVKNPGIYEMTEKDRINDLVLKAGGFTSKASTDNINLSQKLSDEQYIKIPSIDEVKVNSNEILSPNIGIININTASVNELTKLPNIGESTAKEIVKYRENKGGFNRLEEWGVLNELW